MPANDHVNIKVGFTVDKTGLDEIQTALQQLNKRTAAQVTGVEPVTQELQQASAAATQLQDILAKSWNTQLNQLDISKFNQQLSESGLSLTGLAQTLDAAGEKGTLAFNKLATSILDTNVQVKQSNQFLNSMADTLSKTIKWTAASSAIRKVTSSIREAWNFTKDLDESLNNIRIVTGKSADEMAEFAVQANNAAKAMGATTTDYTNASLIFYQQGLSDEEVQARTDVVTKVANVTGQAASEVADNLTAVWNGYQVTAEQAEESIDILAAVAANTASNLEELSTGMTKVAAAANEMGVGEAQLAAQISTIVSATRQAPETVGQALKTVYARMSTINAGGEDEDDGATLTSYSAKMKQFGIDVLDTNGHLRDMGEVIEEIGGKWEDFSRETQISLAQAMAGTRQYVNVMALFENWDQYEKTLEIANNSMGTLQQQQDIYMESTEAHLNKLTASTETLYMTLFDTSSMNKLIDVFTMIINRVNDLMSSMGGGMQTMVNLALLVARIFSNQLATGITKFIENQKIRNANEQYYKDLVNEIAQIQQAINTRNAQFTQNTKTAGTLGLEGIGSNAELESYTKSMKQISEISRSISAEQQKSLKDQAKQLASVEGTLAQLNAQQQKNTENQVKGSEQVSLYYETQAEQEQIASDNAQKQFSILTSELPLVQNLTNARKDEATGLTETKLTEEQLANLEQYRKSIASALGNMLEDQLLVGEQREQVEAANTNFLKQEEITQDQITEILMAALDLRRKHKEASEDLLAQSKATKQIEENKIPIYENQKKHLQENINAQVEQIKQAQRLSMIISSISTMAITLSQIQSIITVVTDEDLSNGEKAKQLITTMLMMVPMLISMFVQLNNQIKAMNAEASLGIVIMTALKAIVQPTAIIFEAMTAIIIAFVAVIANQAVKAANQFKNALDDATEAAERLSAATDDVVQSLEDLQSAIDAYEDAKSTLDECTQGTEDWKSALKDTNDAALDLLNTISDLGNIGLTGDQIRNVYNSSTGEFDQDILNQVLQAQQKASYRSQLAEMNGTYRVAQAQTSVDIQKALQNSGSNLGTDAGITNPGKNTQYWTEELNKNLDKFIGLTTDEALNVLDTLMTGVDKNSEKWITLADSLIETANTLDTAAANFETSSLIILQQAFGDEYEDTALEFAEKNMEAYEKEREQYWKNLVENTGSFSFLPTGDKNKSSYQEILEALQEAGYDYTEKNFNAIKANGEFVFKDENGKNVSLSATEIAEMIAPTEAWDAVEGYAENATEALNNFDEAMASVSDQGDAISQGIRDFINSDNIEEMSQQSAEALNEILSNALKNAEDGVESNDAIISYFADQFGITEDQLTQWLGDDFGDSLLEATSSYMTAIDHVADNARVAVQEIFDDLDDLDLSTANIAAQESVAKVLSDAFTYGGETALDSTVDLYKQLADSSDDALNSFADVIDLMDWGTVTIDDLTEAMDDADISTDGLDTELIALIDALNQAAGATKDAREEFEEMYGSIHDIIDSLNTEDTIDSDKYIELSGYLDQIGINADYYFTRMLDGTYKLTKAADEFQKTVQDALINQAIQQIANLQQQYQNLANFNVGLGGNAHTASFTAIETDTTNAVSGDVYSGPSAESVQSQVSDLSDLFASQLSLSNPNIQVTYDINPNLELNEDQTNRAIQAVNDQISEQVRNNADFDLTSASNLQLINLDGSQIRVDVDLQVDSEATDQFTAWFTSLEDPAQQSIVYSLLIDPEIDTTSWDLNDWENNLDNWIIIDNNNIINIDAIQQEVNALKDLQNADLEQVGVWQDLIDTGQMTVEVANEINKAYTDVAENTEELIAANEEEQIELYRGIMETANSLDELYEVMEETTTALGKSAAATDAFNQRAYELTQAARIEDLDTDEISSYAKYLQQLSKETEGWAKDVGISDSAAKSLATQIMRMNNAVEDLNENFEDWSDILKKSDKASQEYWEALEGVNGALADLLDMNESAFSSSFAVDNLDLIEQAAYGAEDAIDALREAALEDFVLNLSLSEDSVYQTNEELLADVQEIQAQLDDQNWEIGVGVDLSGVEDGENELIDACNQMILDAQMTADEVTDMFSGMGYDVTFAEEPQSVTTTIPHYLEHYSPIESEEINVGTDENPEMRKIYNIEHWTEELEPEIVEGDTEAFALQTSAPGTTVVPKINSITKKASGAANNYSSKNAGGKSLTPTSSGGSSGKSSGSTSEPKQEDHVEDQSDRYHDINLRLQDISTSLARIQRQESKLLGQALIDNLNAQLATLDDYIDATTVKIEIATQEAAELRAELSSQGVTFDSNGYISNYQAAMDAQLATVNAVIDKYNGMSAEEQEAYEDTLQNAKDAYNDFVEALNNYDTLIHETIPGLEDDITDALDQEIQINISKFTMAVEIRLDMDQAEKDWNEFYRKVILGLSDSDLIGQALQDVLDYQSYFDTGSGTGVVQSLTDQINDTLDQLRQYDESGWMSVYGDDYAQAFEDLQTYQSELMEILEDIEDVPYEMWEYYTQAIEEATDAVNDHMKAYEDMQSVLDHQLNLIEILYGDEAYDYINGVYDQMLEYDEKQLAEYRNQMDMYQGYMNQAYEKMQQALADGDEEAYKQWYEVYSMWYDAYYDAADSLLTVLEDSFEIAIQKYENSLNQITNDFNQELFGTDLDWASTMWDLQNQYADMYLDTINAMYEVEKLQQKYLDAIDATDSIKGQQELNALMEDQIGYLQEKDKLTQYDIDHAELEYEIALKRIALEEAQQEKSSMRLRRDSQGNYTYQYVTDEDEISNLRSQLLDLEQQLYNLDVNQYKQNISDLLSTIQDFEEQYIDIMTDLTLTDEERQDRLEELYEMYAMLIYGYAEQVETSEINLVQDTFGALEEMYAQDPEMYNAMLKDELAYLRIEEDDIEGTYKERQQQFREMYGNIYGYAEDAEGNIQYVGKETADAMTKIAMDEDETLQKTIASITNGITDNYIQPVADAIYEAGQEGEDDTNSFMDNALKAFETIFGDFIQEGWDAEQEAEKAIGDLEKAAGYTTDDIINGFEDIMEQVEQNIDVTEEYTDAMWDQLDAIIELCEWLERMIKDYQGIVDAAKEAIQASEDYIKSVQEQNAQAAETEKDNMTGGGSSSSSSGSSSSSSSSSTTQGNGKVEVGDKVTLDTTGYWEKSSGTGNYGTKYKGKQLYVTKTVSDTGKNYPIHLSTENVAPTTPANKYQVGWVKKSQISGYETGGYTGEWQDDGNKDGALAFLHQKELVLNQQDTQNLLAAVNVVRDVADLLSNLDTDVLTHMHDMMFLTKLQNTDYDSANDLLEQDVHIEANFPNVTNSNEIEQAFNNLVNVASQHAHRAKVRR